MTEEEKRQQTVQKLREEFEPLLARLTPDIEPATVYAPARLPSDEE